MGYELVRHAIICLHLACTERHQTPLRRRRITQEAADVNDAVTVPSHSTPTVTESSRFPLFRPGTCVPNCKRTALILLRAVFLLMRCWEQHRLTRLTDETTMLMHAVN